MKLFIKISLVILVIVLIAPFFIEGRDGKPLMTLDELQKPDALPKMADKVIDLVNGSSDQPGVRKDRIYSWRDENGRLHYSNIEPADKSSVKTVEVDPGINVIGADDPDAPKGSRLPVPPAEDEEASKQGPGMIRVYEPGANE